MPPSRRAREPEVILPRQAGVEYDVDDDGVGWLVRTNRPGPRRRTPATNFALYQIAAGSQAAPIWSRCCRTGLT